MRLCQPSIMATSSDRLHCAVSALGRAAASVSASARDWP
jgi:hypothetical protein